MLGLGLILSRAISALKTVLISLMTSGSLAAFSLRYAPQSASLSRSKERSSHANRYASRKRLNAAVLSPEFERARASAKRTDDLSILLARSLSSWLTMRMCLNAKRVRRTTIINARVDRTTVGDTKVPFSRMAHKMQNSKNGVAVAHSRICSTLRKSVTLGFQVFGWSVQGKACKKKSVGSGTTSGTTTPRLQKQL